MPTVTPKKEDMARALRRHAEFDASPALDGLGDYGLRLFAKLRQPVTKIISPDSSNAVILHAADLGTSPQEKAEAWFTQLYDDHSAAILNYALRRTMTYEDAADVVAETFLIAWRRAAVVPDSNPRAWLYGVARRILANQRRASLREMHLISNIGHGLAARLIEAPASAAEIRMEETLERMKPEDREILQLAAWEQLRPSEIAAVLGISAITARTRLHRARRRFEKEVDAADDPAGIERRAPEREAKER